MTRGDLVHIPQGALLLRNKSANISEAEFLKIEKFGALFWEEDPKEPGASVYYKEMVWDIRIKDIYPITQELENVVKLTEVCGTGAVTVASILYEKYLSILSMLSWSEKSTR